MSQSDWERVGDTGFHLLNQEDSPDAQERGSEKLRQIFYSNEGLPSSQPRPPIICPECRSSNVSKNGSVKKDRIRVQRFDCSNCGRKFVDPSISFMKPKTDTSTRQLCDSKTEESKKLIEVEAQKEEPMWGATSDLKVLTDQFRVFLTKKQLRESTKNTYVYAIRFLIKLKADIFNPDDVNYVMGQQNWRQGRKNNIIKAYTWFTRMLGIEDKWDKPKMETVKTLPRPPSTQQVIALTSGSSRKYCMIFMFMAQTGAIAIETSDLTSKNFDFERNQVLIKGHKGHLDRFVPLYLFGSRLPELMKQYLDRYGSFPKASTICSKFRKYRNRTAKKIGDKSLMGVRLEDLRHFFATEYYRRYHLTLELKQYMGHTKSEMIDTYTKIVPSEQPSYVTKPVTTVEEGLELGKQGWEKYDEMNGVHLYRRKKTFEELTNEKGSETSEKGLWSSLV